MDKEMKAKIDEILKDYGRRELSPDELDKVNGGKVEGMYGIDGNYYSEQDIVNLGRITAKNLGYNVAAEILCELFMMRKTEIAKQLRGTGDDVASIDAFICQMFNVYDRINGSGHSY